MRGLRAAWGTQNRVRAAVRRAVESSQLKRSRVQASLERAPAPAPPSRRTVSTSPWSSRHGKPRVSTQNQAKPSLPETSAPGSRTAPKSTPGSFTGLGRPVRAARVGGSRPTATSQALLLQRRSAEVASGVINLPDPCAAARNDDLTACPLARPGCHSRRSCPTAAKPE